MNWWSRLRRRNRLEEQLEKELRFHLDQQENDLIARGHSPSQARRKTRTAFGGPEQIKEMCRDARGTRWAEEFLQDARYALRTFHQKPGFVIVTLLILALGIGATTVMFALVNSVLLRPLPFPEPDRIVILHGFMRDFGEFWGFSYPDFNDLKHESRSFTVAAWTYSSGTISAPGDPEHMDARQISAELFPVLGVTPTWGRRFRPGEDRPGATPVAIISYGLWQRRFASERAVIGREFTFDGKPYQVVGVAPPGFQLSGEADVYTPLGQSTDPKLQNREAHFIEVVGLLAPGVTQNQAQAELTLISRRLAEQYPKSNAGLSMRIHPLLQQLVSDVRGTLWLLLAAIGLVLLIACVNIASLFLTRAVSRERELAMRAALGAGRSRLVRQCMTESAVLGLCGGVLGIAAAAVSVHPFVALWPGSLPRAQEIHIDWRVLSFGVGISLLCGLLFGLTPALRVPMHRLEEALRAGGRSVTGTSRLHSPFVISEIALAFVLLVSAGMLGRTLLALSTLNPGFHPHNVLAARFAISPKLLGNPSQIRSAWRDVLDRVRHVPDVEFAALTDIIPMREGENVGPYRTTPNPLPPNQEPFALDSCVTPDYLKVMGIPLLEGRFFNEHDREGSQSGVVIDENLAQHAFGRKNVVGQHIWLPATGDATPVAIIGVVGHVRHWGLAGDDQSRVHDQMYYPFAQLPDRWLHLYSSVMSIAIRTRTSPLKIVEPLQRELRGMSGDQTLYDIRTMEQLVEESLSRQRFLSLLFGIFAGLALLLASIGVYGVLAYLTGQRTSEIGVRMALGANVRDITRLVVGQGLKMTIAGLSLGILAALAAGQTLQHLVEGIQPVGGVTFAITVPLLILAALLASFVPARRASLVDPVKALRQE